MSKHIYREKIQEFIDRLDNEIIELQHERNKLNDEIETYIKIKNNFEQTIKELM